MILQRRRLLVVVTSGVLVRPVLIYLNLKLIDLIGRFASLAPHQFMHIVRKL